MAIPDDFSHYNVYRSDLLAGPYVLITSTTSLSFEDTTAVPGNTYFYQVTSVDLYGNESAPSSPISVNFSTFSGPIDLSSFGPQNVVVVYRDSDSESLEFAERYQSIHGLEDEQLVSVPCSSLEVVADYATFQTEVETPLFTALTTSPLSDRAVRAIVLMPRVVGGFNDETDVISATSRLSRIFHTFSKKIRNDLFDRKVFQRFDSDDSDIGLIVTRFDSPLSAVTSNWFDFTEDALRQLFTTGTFYIDPFSDVHRAGAEEYTNELLFFNDNLLQKLGLSTQTTVQIRAFFYSADPMGAATVRDIDARTWPTLAMRSNYVATAGHMSDPDVDGYLRPTPFFDALFRGATLGEAMLYSVPHFDWTTAFFGDPLLKFSFPEEFDDTELIDVDKGWGEMVDCQSQSIVNMFRKSVIIKQLRDAILSGDDVQVALDLVIPVERMKDTFNDTFWKETYVNLSKDMVKYVTARNQVAYDRFFPKLADYLAITGNTVTDLFLDTLQNPDLTASIPAENIEEEGTWDFKFNLEHTPGTFAFYHFELDVASDIDFDDILISRKSINSVTSWSFENSEDNFEQMPVNGVTSNFAGKSIKYISQEGENLERGVYYYFRIRQRDQLTTFSYRTFREVIYK
jgi:hypothetical protein